MSITAPLLALALAQASPAPAGPVPAPKPAASAPKPAVPPKPAAPTASQAAAQPEATPAAPEPELPRFGVSLLAAVPEGAALAFMYRPIPFIRLWAGPAWNYTSFGLQGGVGLVLARWAVTPVLSVEAGRYFSTDLTPYFKNAGSIPDEMEPLLHDVKYTYAAAHLGLEFGSQRGFSFCLRLGLAAVAVKTSGSGEVVTDPGTPDETHLVFVDPRFGAVAPSLKLGFNYWF